MADRRNVLEYLRLISRRVQDVKVEQLFGAVLPRVETRDKHEHTTIHPRPLIKPKITTFYLHGLPLVVHLPLEALWNYMTDILCSKLGY
jgi:hypothetical protein